MTISNWNTPISTDDYVDVLAALKDRDTLALTQGESPAGVSAQPVGAKRWNPGTKKWERWNGSTWNDLADTYAINVQKLGGKGISDLLLATARGAANGVASLDVNSRVPSAQIGALDAGSSPAAGYAWQQRRLSAIQIAAYSGSNGEVVLNTTTGRLHVMNGSTAGGAALALLSDLQTASPTTLSVSGNGTIGGTLRVGNSVSGLLINGANLTFGAMSAPNTENWNRLFDMIGGGTTRLSLRTVAGMQAGLWLDDSGAIMAASGAYAGTRSNHDFRLITNNTTRIVLKASGNIGIGVNAPLYPLDIQGRLRVQDLVLNKDFTNQLTPSRIYVGTALDTYLQMVNNPAGRYADFHNFDEVSVNNHPVVVEGPGQVVATIWGAWRGRVNALGGIPDPISTVFGSKNINTVLAEQNRNVYENISLPTWTSCHRVFTLIFSRGVGSGDLSVEIVRSHSHPKAPATVGLLTLETSGSFLETYVVSSSPTSVSFLVYERLPHTSTLRTLEWQGLTLFYDLMFIVRRKT